LAEEIYGRAARIVASMIKEIIETDPPPVKQVGKATLFRRRKPEQSRVPKKLGSLEELFDHLRMLDASGYPKAFLEWGGFRYEISRPALRTEEIQAEVRIRPIPKGNHV
jgi:methionyl-tRNA formyltransferase